jgi:DNA mismatch endonuclease (patch repair protein)
MPRFDSLGLRSRSKLMATIRKTDTKPEIAVRRIVHGLGYRFRLYRKDLPGTPDLALLRHRKAIFVNGCFWHRHECALGRKMPRTNVDYWVRKFRRTIERDLSSAAELERMGWARLVVWECELHFNSQVAERLERFL